MRLLTLIVLLGWARIAPAAEVKTLNTLRNFPQIESKKEWEARAKEIREQALVSCGLMPMPAKTPLNARVFGKVEREGYSIEKVYFESIPGFYVAGNLYRPLGKKGPFPGVLNPHGHWRNGRMADETDGSIAARCINFARQGMVAFSWDMVGYNDTTQVNHKFAAAPENQLWNISLMGLQTWNTIRALDFLESLPDVDRKRLACTGESGGGTQTFMLGAVDDRPAVLAPIVMVSHSMQGGCLCENAPGLRVEYSNMEIAAVPAPKPQILVAASGDWTKATMSVEGPAIESIYKLYGAEDRFDYVLFNYPHNYNKTSREPVYQFFGKHLLEHRNPSSLKELPYKKEPDGDLRVFPDGKLPAGAMDEKQLITYFKDRSKALLKKLTPSSKRESRALQNTLLPLWKHSLQVQPGAAKLTLENQQSKTNGTYSVSHAKLKREDDPETIPVIRLRPNKPNPNVVVLIASGEGKKELLNSDGTAKGLAAELLQNGYTVVGFEPFLSGSLANEKLLAERKHYEGYFTTYNKTDLQRRVDDLVTVTTALKGPRKGPRVILYGMGEGAIWSMLAAPVADGVVADAGEFRNVEEDWIKQSYFAPGVMALGGVDGTLAIAAPAPAMISAKFRPQIAQATYKATGDEKKLILAEGPLTSEKILSFLKAFR